MKKNSLRYLRISAAVAAVAYGAASHAQTLTWDAGGVTPPTDGSGNWDTTSSLWYNGTTVQSWTNGDSALLGTGSNPSAGGPAYTIALNAPNIITQDIVFGTPAAGGFYNIADQGGGAEHLTLNGNIVKTSAVGTSIVQLTNAMTLSAGSHVVALNDTPGQVPEVEFNSAITGSGSITMNNALNSSGYAQWGALVLNVDNTYSGGTNLVDGAIFANSSNALGTGTVAISGQGVLQFGGEGTVQPAAMTITNPVIITRNTYTGTNFNDYPDAIISANTGNAAAQVTFSGPFIVDSNDARVAANTSTVIIASNLQQGPDVTNGVLTLDGDFAGFVSLTGNNTAYSAAGGSIRLINGVELNVANLNNLGGATATLTMNGGTFHPVAGFIPNFGTLNVNYSTFNGGVDIDPNTTFSISQNLGASGNTTGSIGERGAGTLTLSGTDILGGSTYWDGWGPSSTGGNVKGGVVNVSGSLTLGSLHLRSPIVNVTGAIVLNDPAGGQYNSWGESSGGTFGGPDQAVVNISGSGSVAETTGDDFNISDNSNTTCTINISGSGALTTGGITWLGKNNGATGTINQNGGSLTINRNGNFGLILGDGRGTNLASPTGNYNLSAGTFFDENGEIYVGEGTNSGNPGTGNWTQTGGTATFGNWFVVGREGGKGTVTISGGSLTKDTTNGGANVSIGEGGSNVCTVTVENTGIFNIQSGQVFVGNNSSVGIMNVGSPSDPVSAHPAVTVNDWFAIGRNGTSVGTLNLYDGSVTQQTRNFFDIGGDGGSAQGTVNVYGGTLTALNTWIGENGSCVGVLNMNGGAASLGGVQVGLHDTAHGTINLNGGTIQGTSFSGGTGTPLFNFNGGTLTASASSADYVDASLPTVVSTGGAIINPAGNSITINAALTHNTSISGADGGLTVNGAGTVIANGADTYNGATKVTAGTLVIGTGVALPSGTAVAITNGTLQLGTSTGLATISSLAITGNGTFDANNNHMILNYGAGPDPISSIAALLAKGYNGGAWNGAGGIVTSAPLVVGGLSYGLGYADSADAGNPAGLASGTLEVKYTLLGDADLNGIVNGIDFGILAANFNKGVTGWDKGDFDYNNIVNGIDFGLLAANFNKGASGASVGAPAYADPAIMAFATANGLLADVPEPASLGLLAVGSVGILARRRRRNAN